MLSPSGRVARSAERGHDRTRPLQSAIADSFPSVACLFHGFPLPEKKFSELHFFRQKWESFPYVKASPCFFLLSQKSAKIVSRYAASPRGEAPPRGGGEEKLAFLFCLKICLAKNFQTKGQLHFRLKSFRANQCAPHSPRFRSAPSPQGEGFALRRFRSFSAKKPGCISYLRIICNPADFLQFFAPRFCKGTKYTP